MKPKTEAIADYGRRPVCDRFATGFELETFVATFLLTRSLLSKILKPMIPTVAGSMLPTGTIGSRHKKDTSPIITLMFRGRPEHHPSSLIFVWMPRNSSSNLVYTNMHQDHYKGSGTTPGWLEAFAGHAASNACLIDVRTRFRLSRLLVYRMKRRP